MADSTNQVLLFLSRSRDGNRESFDQLFVQLYAELRRLAASYLRGERPEHTLQPTALVHEAYVKLLGQQQVDWKNRAHFFAVAAQAMRRILIDHARTRTAEKRTNGFVRVPLDDVIAEAEHRDVDLLALDLALEKLEHLDPRLCRVVELRYFAGLTTAEVSEVLGISAATVDRDRVTATVWIRRELGLGAA